MCIRDSAWGGEILVPKIPSYRITELAQAIAPSCKQEIVGIRAGEKIHEEMITASDSFTTYDLGKYYAILPQSPAFEIDAYVKHFGAKPVERGFHYNSGTNTQWLGVDELRALIRKHVDPEFEPR